MISIKRQNIKIPKMTMEDLNTIWQLATEGPGWDPRVTAAKTLMNLVWKCLLAE